VPQLKQNLLQNLLPQPLLLLLVVVVVVVVMVVVVPVTRRQLLIQHMWRAPLLLPLHPLLAALQQPMVPPAQCLPVARHLLLTAQWLLLLLLLLPQWPLLLQLWSAWTSSISPW
jgi:hypothetical protein